jgi:tetraacyldisaccharide 4'-kinase
VIATPLSRLYGSALALRAHLYASGRIRSVDLPRPSVSVGNLTFGGTGKTPFVEFLARRFRFEGRQPAVLSRGYGRRTRGVVVVSAGQGPLVSPEEGGDEPVALSRRLPGVLVVVGERRSDAARRAADLGADLFLLDDGFQHLAVRRDVNLLLLDARDPFGGGSPPPGGRLRDPVSALRRADAIVFTRVDRADPPAEALAEISRLHPRAPIFHARIRPVALCDENDSPIDPSDLEPRRLIAACGIAGPPSDFAGSLRELGLHAEELLAFRDHQRYDGRALSRIRRAADRCGASWIVTTSKDAVKLAGRIAMPVVSVRLSVEVLEPEFFPFLLSRLPRDASRAGK